MNPFTQSSAFTRTVTDTPQGALREALITRALCKTIVPPPRRIIDIGCGEARVARMLAHTWGCAVQGFDPSPDMLRIAKGTLHDVPHTLQLLTIDEVRASVVLGQGDLVLCHAVLNWHTDPETALTDLLAWARAQQGTVSLVLGSLHGYLLEACVRGRPLPSLIERRVQSASYPDTTLYLFDPLEVRSQLDASGATILFHGGVRTLFDLAPQPNLDTFLALEESVAEREPYRSLGDLTHFVFQYV